MSLGTCTGKVVLTVSMRQSPHHFLCCCTVAQLFWTSHASGLLPRGVADCCSSNQKHETSHASARSQLILSHRPTAAPAPCPAKQIVTAITEQLMNLNGRMLKVEAHMELLDSMQQTAHAQHITEPLTHPAQPSTAETESPAFQPQTECTSLPLRDSQQSQAAAPASIDDSHPGVHCESRQESHAAVPAVVLEQLTALLERMSAMEAHVQRGVAAARSTDGAVPDLERLVLGRCDWVQGAAPPTAAEASKPGESLQHHDVVDMPPVSNPLPQEQLSQNVSEVQFQQQLQPPPPHQQQLQALPLHQQPLQQPLQHQQQLGVQSQQVTPRSRYKVTTPSPSPDSPLPHSLGHGRSSSDSLSQELLDTVTNTEDTPAAGCRFDLMATPSLAETPWFDPLPSPFQPEASPVPAAAAAGYAGLAARGSPAPGLLQPVQEVVTTPTGPQQRPGRFGVQVSVMHSLIQVTCFPCMFAQAAVTVGSSDGAGGRLCYKCIRHQGQERSEICCDALESALALCTVLRKGQGTSSTRKSTMATPGHGMCT